MASSIEEWRERSAYWLCGKDAADCSSPDAPDSAGADFLIHVRNDTLELLESVGDDLDPETIDHDGSVHEIADGAPNVYTTRRWSQFLDLEAYNEEPELGQWPDSLNDAAGIALYQIAERLAWAIIRDVHEWRQEQADDPGDDDPEPDPATDPADVESLPDDVRPDWH